MTNPHIPVMLPEVLHYLNPQPDGLYVDGTFGLGNYSEAILKLPGTNVLAIDQDPTTHTYADRLQKLYPSRFTFVPGNFDALVHHTSRHTPHPVDGIVLDLGVSSPQLDVAERGFSFLRDGPLDMRMGLEGPTAGDLVNTLPVDKLTTLFRTYGEERKARKIANAIAARRGEQPFTRTLDLARIIEAQFSPRERRQMAIHPATRVFQALRIATNDELGALERALEGSVHILGPGGTLVVVSFHSLEDRLVKNFMASQAGKEQTFMPKDLRSRDISFAFLTGKPIRPTEQEQALNPRARSAKLRAARRLPIPITPEGGAS